MDDEFAYRNIDRHFPERVFVTDLMTHISRAHGLRHMPFETMCNFGLCPDSPFKKNIREAVDRLMSRVKTLSLRLYARLVGFNHPTIEEFELVITQMGFQLSLDGFRERAFLEYCTTACLMAILARRNGLPSAPNSCALIIVDVIQSFKLLGGWPDNAWEDIEREAEYFQF